MHVATIILLALPVSYLGVCSTGSGVSVYMGGALEAIVIFVTLISNFRIASVNQRKSTEFGVI